MRRRQGKVNRWVLVVLAAVSVVLFFFVNRSLRVVKSRLYDLKLASAQLSEQALSAVKEYRQQLGIPIDSVNDPNRTGLVGLEYSQTTYGRSDLSDALVTTNPNFSAALVEMMYKAGVRPGDSITISWDGTYPALNIQMLVVARTMQLRPVIVSALSSGSWGANYPGMTWPDIERVLGRSGLWSHRSRWVSLGGRDDAGQSLSPEGRAILSAAADSAGLAFGWDSKPAGNETPLDAGVNARVAATAGTKAYVSIGRPLADLGSLKARIPSRVFRARWTRGALNSAIDRLRARGFPVVHIGNPGQVALDYHLPMSSQPLPRAGKGRLFFEHRYSTVMSAAFALVLLVLLFIVVRYDVEWYLGVREETGDKEAV